MSLLGALFAGLAVLVWQPPWSWVRVRVDDVAVPRPGAGSALAVVAVAVTGSLVVLPAAPVIVGWTGLVIVAVGWRRARRSHGRKRRLAVRDETQLIVDALVAELRSGAPPEIVVRRLAAESALIEPAAVVGAAGGDVAAALRAAGARPGAEPLADVGRAWAVSQECGAPLAGVLEQVRAAAREERELHRELAAGVAPARATVALVAAMPPLGLALGSGLGVDPLGVVLTTVPGALCLAAGVGCAVAGIVWIDLIADRAEAGA